MPRSLFHAGEARRLEELIREGHHQRAVFLGLGALLQPLRVGRERRPFLLALGHRLVGDEIDQVVVRLADFRGPEAGLLDAVLLEQLQRDGIEALEQVGHPPRHRAIAAHLVDHVSSRYVWWPRAAMKERHLTQRRRTAQAGKASLPLLSWARPAARSSGRLSTSRSPTP